ncbi:TetR/AcrR family transcriptional regulator [Roseomonas chloroacetimidivorans]|uniref:TetR/AcrR family transcriptional regulator n=1 Tax=Roseomonas chloroacetimidivorans TaxID=1766656 RepID=UPI003C74440D
MRVTREKAAENRARIVEVASRLFRERGFDGVGLDEIMRAAGLTHGGFYRHFASKEELAAEALAHGLAAGEARGAEGIEAFLDYYLSPEHRDAREAGCAVAALAVDAGRGGSAVRTALTRHLHAAFDRLSARLGGREEDRRARAIAGFAGLVGAVVLARAVEDEALSSEILEAARRVHGAVLEEDYTPSTST